MRVLAIVVAAPLLAALTLACASEPVGPADPPPTAVAAPLQSYIVLLDPAADVPALVERFGVPAEYIYIAAIRGYATEPITPGQAIALARQKGVISVSASRRYRETPVPDAISAAASWGLDRIDQRKLPLSGTYAYSSAGAGIVVYIVDTGIRYTHQEFGGRAVFGFDAYGGNGSDCRGHGTHVAGTVGGASVGVARGVTLKSVRILDCTGFGTTAALLAGLDYVAQQPPGVVNLSLSGPVDPPIDAAVAALTARGFAVAAAAGNNHSQDACNYSPARAPSAVTTGSTTASDDKAVASNIGPCVDLYAPGVGITSAGTASDAASAIMGGTSMATAHVSGLLARRMGAGLSGAAAAASVISAATERIPRLGGGAKGRLLFADPAS